MLKRLLLLLTITFFCFNLSFSQSTGVYPAYSKCHCIDETSLLKHVRNLSSDAFEGRKTGTKGAKKAKNYIINEFYKLKVSPFKKSYKQDFYFIKKGNGYNATNVLGFIPGTCSKKKYIVISAHYDHLGIKKGKVYNGADDNASGVSALLTMAKYLKQHPPKHAVIFVAFDGEEQDLQGSKYFVNSNIVPLNKIALNINMDMISRSDNNELFVVGTAYNSALKKVISHTNFSKKIKLTRGHDGFDGKTDWTYSSDHTWFYKKNIPFLYFGVADHDDYHEPTDVFENIQPEFYTEAVNTILSVFKKLDDYLY